MTVNTYFSENTAGNNFDSPPHFKASSQQDATYVAKRQGINPFQHAAQKRRDDLHKYAWKQAENYLRYTVGSNPA